MTWTNEMIAAFVLLALAVVGLLQRFGILKLPFSRNNNPKPANCDKRHDKIDAELKTMGEGQIEHKIQIEDIKDRLDKGETRFDKFQEDIGVIKTNVAVIKETMNQQYGFMTDSMKLILKKIG